MASLTDLFVQKVLNVCNYSFTFKYEFEFDSQLLK